MNHRSVYLDNAASSPMVDCVVDKMTQIMRNCYGNPSSIHRPGRTARSHIEEARRSVAVALRASIGEIFFTSGGTESNNMAIKCSVADLGVRHIISTNIEHKCVLGSIRRMGLQDAVEVHMCRTESCGQLDLRHLTELLQMADGPTLVSVIHAHNELGTLNDLSEISAICRSHGAYLHSDTVQTIGHFPIDLESLDIDFISASAHKFHGPKGVGFIYINSNLKIRPYIDGGGQERNMRGGTENIYGIAGLATALSYSIEHIEEHRIHIDGLRSYLKKHLEERIPGVVFNGAQNCDQYLYTVLNVSFPPSEKTDMLSFNLDMAGIHASGGSACTSGVEAGSYVISSLGLNPGYKTIRFSFSHLNTLEEMKYVVDTLEGILIEAQPA